MSDFFGVRKFGVAAILASGLWSNFASGAERLPAYGADLSRTSVSGISSGGAMAVQFHVAHSSIVKGAGVIAGPPYDCAEQSANRATQNCMKPDAFAPAPDPAHLRAITDTLAGAGAVDDVANLKASRIWLFHGHEDKIVLEPVMDALRAFYGFYVPAADDRVVYLKGVRAGHAMVTDDYSGAGCAVSAPPYVEDCDFDAAHALLEQLYGALKPRNDAPEGRYVEFDQKEFLPDGDAYNHSLADTGFAYVPKDCETQSCRVHVALHGCLQQKAEVDDAFYKHAGYNRWADTNQIIVLYPQTISRWGWGWPFYTFNWRWNPNACWDWWGYDSAEHHTKTGPQVAAIRAMVERVAAPR